MMVLNTTVRFNVIYVANQVVFILQYNFTEYKLAVILYVTNQTQQLQAKSNLQVHRVTILHPKC